MPTQKDTTNVRSTAVELAAAGVSVIPIRADGTKRPAVQWKAYQTERPTSEELDRWFRRDQFGLGIILGHVSGDLEMTELEGRVFEHDPEFLDRLEAFMRVMGQHELFDRLANGWVETSPSGGLHWFYRLADGPVPGNTKIAREPGPVNEATGKPVPDVLAETRGEGGYAVVAPTGGTVHHTGRSWDVIGDGHAAVATITVRERTVLHDALFALLDTWEESEHAHQPTTGPAAPRTSADERSKVYGEGESPADHFDRVADWADLLEPLGWTFSKADPDGTRYWLRPESSGHVGADWSASTNRDGLNNLYVWSPSAGLPTEEVIKPTMFRALTETGGDYGRMVGKLRKEGFGAPMERHDVFTADELNGLRQGSPGKAEGGDADGPLGASSPGTTAPGVDPAARLFTGQQRVAYAYAAACRGELMHVRNIGWFYWTGTHWQEDEHGVALRNVAKVLGALIAGALADGDKDAVKGYRKVEGSSAQEGVLKLVSVMPGFAATADDLDVDPYLLNCSNGTLDLRTFELKAHDPADRCTKIAAAFDRDLFLNPDRLADTLFGRFVASTLPDPDVRGFLQRYVGQSLVGIVREHKLAILTGTGRNGKGVFYGAIGNALGGYGTTVENDLLLAREDAHPTGLMDLLGVRWAVVSESDEGRRLAMSTVKRLTGGDRIKARRMRRDFVEFKPSHTLALITNHLPKVQGDDPAIWARLRVVPFGEKFEGANADLDLPMKLEADSSAVLTWLVLGLAEYQARGLAEPEAVLVATREYQADSDVLGQFLDECVVDADSQSKAAGAGELHQAYQDWQRNVPGAPLLSKKQLGTMLDQRAEKEPRLASKRTNVGMVRPGIALRRASER